jgi:hypothetical protein
MYFIKSSILFLIIGEDCLNCFNEVQVKVFTQVQSLFCNMFFDQFK